MTHENDIWGASPGPGYDELAGQFRPLLARIADGTVARERDRRLPFEEIGWLKQARWGALRLPVIDGGFGVTFAQFAALTMELAAADSNIAQAFRAHFGFSEDVTARLVGTHTLHDPVRWKYHSIGQYYLSGTHPPMHSWI
jgi:alkylation response protein AidB-like acyl-CoA dehydrogenase